MKTMVLALLAWTTLAAPALAADPPAAPPARKLSSLPVDAITLTGDQQTTAPLDPAKPGTVTAFLVIGTGCPTTAMYLDRFRALEAAYRGKDVAFVYVYPNRDDTTADKLAFHRQQKLGGRLIDDQGARVARLFGSQRTSDCVLVGKDGTVLFQGGIDDSKDAAGVKQRYAAAALDEYLAGKPVSVPASQVFA